MVNKLVELGKLYTITSGGTPSKRNPEYYLNGDIPWVKTGNLKVMYLNGVEEYITKLGLEKSSAKVFPKGTVLIAMYGATIGNCSILNFDASTNQACAAFNPIDEVLPEYLYFYLNSIKRELIEKGVGGAQPNISLGILKKIKIPLISIDEQRNIIEQLTQAMELIDKRQSQITVLDDLTQSVFFNMFNIELKNNMIELKNVIESLKYGTSEKATENGYPVLRIPNINNGEIDETDMKYCNLEKKAFESYKLEKGDILFVRSNGNQSYVGRCATITSKQEGYIYASYLIRAKVKSNIILSEFITFYLNTAVGRKGVLKKARTSAGQYNINTKGLGELIIPLPNIDKQSEFIALLNDIQNKKGNLKNSLKEMRELYNALLQKAFKGELFQE